MAHDTKQILITGASRGLGLAMTSGFAALGHTVIGCGVRPAGVTALRMKFPPPHRFDVVDVADEVQVAGWAAAVLNDQGCPDLLLNNAAVINPNARLWEVAAEDFSRVIDVNIKGVFHVLRHFVPAMIRRGSGVIVNFSSGWGRSTSPEVATYCTTKWAIEGLTRALADELPGGMAAIPLNPGIVNTEMLQSCFGPHAAGYPGPEEWAEKVVPFLLELGPADSGDPLTAPG